MQREYVMLSTPLKAPHKIPPGMLWSTKYDGMRALWIPTARGMPVAKVPFCDDPQGDRICTGLFSRYGRVLHASETFLNALPDIPLDGELWTARNEFQRIVSICRAHDAYWGPVKFMVFDSPRYTDIFTDGKVNNSVVKMKQIRTSENTHLFGNNLSDTMSTFHNTYVRLSQCRFWNDSVRLVEQRFYKNPDDVLSALERELELNGEGLIGRSASSVWVPKRTKSVVKLKPSNDDEAVIIGHTAGEGKYQGMLGAYIVQWGKKTFQLSGMSDYDREHPLSLGTRVTFRYRNLTADGYPREARFVREYHP